MQETVYTQGPNDGHNLYPGSHIQLQPESYSIRFPPP